MPGAGTDKTRNWIETPGPVVVLVEPQLGENIGAPPAPWPISVSRGCAWSSRATAGRICRRSARRAGADRILDDAVLFDTLEAAIADCTLVLATTARAHDQAKPVIGRRRRRGFLAPHVAAGENVAVVFGRERNGLENDEVGARRPHRHVSGQSGLRLAQSRAGGRCSWPMSGSSSRPAARCRSPCREKSRAGAASSSSTPSSPISSAELEKIEYFRPLDKRATMLVNLRNIFRAHAADPAGHPDPARHRRGARRRPQGAGARRRARRRGGRRRCARCSRNTARAGCRASAVRCAGLARLLRRNPTEAERAVMGCAHQ